jgi:hypothetical protein
MFRQQCWGLVNLARKEEHDLTCCSVALDEILPSPRDSLKAKEIEERQSVDDLVRDLVWEARYELDVCHTRLRHIGCPRNHGGCWAFIVPQFDTGRLLHRSHDLKQLISSLAWNVTTISELALEVCAPSKRPKTLRFMRANSAR